MNIYKLRQLRVYCKGDIAMGWSYKCKDCGEDNKIKYIGDDIFQCEKCGSTNIKEEYIMHPYEARRNSVYATGNKWAIENWNATH